MYETVVYQWWTILGKIFMNTLLVSIPEEFYLLMFTLILVGEFEIWADEDCDRLIHDYDLVRILVPVISTALLSNILRYSGLDYSALPIISIVVFYILIVVTNDIFGDASAAKWMGKAFVFFILAVITLFVAEFSTVSIFLYASGKTVAEVNSNIFLNFIASLPSRIIEYSILGFLIVKKRTLLKANLIKPIFESKISLSLTLTALIFDLAFMLVMVKVIAYEKILNNIPEDLRVIIIFGVTLFPLVNLSALVWGFYNIKNKELQDKKETADKINGLAAEIDKTGDDKYDNIKWKLYEISSEMRKISDSLYNIGEK